VSNPGPSSGGRGGPPSHWPVGSTSSSLYIPGLLRALGPVQVGPPWFICLCLSLCGSLRVGHIH
jgi:hypothetical protein